MPGDPIRPYSRQQWIERQRRFALEQARRRRFRRYTLALIGAVVVLIMALIASMRVPDNWRQRVRETGKQLLKGQ